MAKLPTGGTIAVILGVYEFWMVYKMVVTQSGDKNKLFPSSFYDDRATNALLCVFTLFIGLLRLIWAFSGKTVGSWLSC